MKRILFALAATALAVSAQAQTASANLTGTTVTSMTPTELNGCTGAQASDCLHLTNSALGSLASATLTVYSSIGGTITLNNTGSATTARGFTDSAFTFSSGISALDTLLNALALNPTYNTGNVAVAANSSSNALPYGATDSGTVTLTGALLSQIGSGPLTIECTTLTSQGSSQVGGGGNATVGGTFVTNAGCGATLQYTVAQANNVPEPSSLALIGLALAGAGVVSRRRKA